MEAYTKNSADKEQVKNAEQRERLKNRRISEDLISVLQTFEGRRVVWRWLGFCRIDQISYADRNSSETAFREGHRNVGLMIKSQIMEADPELFRTMESEAIGGKYE